jgi:hypothetical protein
MLSRPSADSFAVGRRQKVPLYGYFYNPQLFVLWWYDICPETFTQRHLLRTTFAHMTFAHQTFAQKDTWLERLARKTMAGCFDFKVRPGPQWQTPVCTDSLTSKSPQTWATATFYPTLQCNCIVCDVLPAPIVTEKANFFAIIVGLVGHQTRDSRVARSGANVSAQHYVYVYAYVAIHLYVLLKYCTHEKGLYRVSQKTLNGSARQYLGNP